MDVQADSDPVTPQCIIEAKRRGWDTGSETRVAARMVFISDGAHRRAAGRGSRQVVLARMIAVLVAAVATPQPMCDQARPARAAPAQPPRGWRHRLG